MLFNLQIPKIEAPKEWNIGSIGTEIIVDDIQVGMKMQVKKEKLNNNTGSDPDDDDNDGDDNSSYNDDNDAKYGDD